MISISLRPEIEPHQFRNWSAISADFDYLAFCPITRPEIEPLSGGFGGVPDQKLNTLIGIPGTKGQKVLYLGAETTIGPSGDRHAV